MSHIHGAESIVNKYVFGHHLPKVQCYLVEDFTLVSRLNNTATVEADVYIPGQLMVFETLFHDFGHMTDFVLRGLEWRIGKKDFGFTLHRPAWGEKSKMIDQINLSESRAVVIEYMLLKQMPIEKWNEDEMDFYETIGSKSRFSAERLGWHDGRSRKYWGDKINIEKNDNAWEFLLNRYTDITMETVMPAFAEAVKIFNAAAVDQSLRTTLLYTH